MHNKTNFEDFIEIDHSIEFFRYNAINSIQTYRLIHG